MKRIRSKRRLHKDEAGSRLVTCPFCDVEVDRPEPLEGFGDDPGGRCDCGAVFVADESGRRGGEAMLAVLTALCGGDVAEAMSLSEGRDVDIEGCAYDPKTHTRDPQSHRARTSGMPTLWFALRK